MDKELFDEELFDEILRNMPWKQIKKEMSDRTPEAIRQNINRIKREQVELSDWIVVSGRYATRIIAGGDVDEDRVAFIEKTPRVKVWDMDPSFWFEGPKGSGGIPGNPEEDGTYGFDKDSRQWCDDVLKRMGYKFRDSN